MTVSCSVAEIISQIKFRNNIPTIGAGEFLTESDTILLLNMACERLVTQLSRLYGDQHFTQSDNVTTQVSVPYVSLPSGCLDVLSVTWVKSDGARVQLGHLTNRDYAESPASMPSWDDERPSYQLQGAMAYLYPTPTSAYTLEILYTAKSIATITTTSDTLLLPTLVCKEWLVCEASETIRVREQRPYSEFTERKMQLELIMTEHASQRDRNALHQVVDTENALEDARFRDNRIWRDYW